MSWQWRLKTIDSKVTDCIGNNRSNGYAKEKSGGIHGKPPAWIETHAGDCVCQNPESPVRIGNVSGYLEPLALKSVGSTQGPSLLATGFWVSTYSIRWPYFSSRRCGGEWAANFLAGRLDIICGFGKLFPATDAGSAPLFNQNRLLTRAGTSWFPLQANAFGMTASVASAHPQQGGLPFATAGEHNRRYQDQNFTALGW